MLSFVRSTVGIAICLAAPLLHAESTAADTLEKIRQTHTITIGNREAARPFSFLNDQKQPVGYSIDLCLKAIDQIKKDLKLPELKVQYVTVSGAERIPKLQEGAIDIECGSTTNTKARQEKVDFSYTIFVAGMKLLTRTNSGVANHVALAGKPVALSKGTTSEKLFTQLRDSELGSMKLVQFPSNLDAIKALESGSVAAFPQDDVLLTGLLSTRADASRFALVGDYLSVEPYAIMVRKSDDRLLAIIDKSLKQIYASGEINAIYERWFNTETLKLPMSRLMRDSVMRPSKEPGIARVLGYSL
ncbi:glutamate/aspartate ABC transporter substrate-binding protein [Niveibacterium umoris]|uniref:Glutamate/aspartate transport system substrate-binding protein n=1 Tax=Niveibacterium umoris TaxID=1193620 RepID=A0A840BH08_9RHOO|nr:amino acid ABC transporter substrate-binding protein [Niveibacterium umoris]MBB4011943.1 glutamate/aspartate transport system substrate-binding protein [Niveibacterium umoris]